MSSSVYISDGEDMFQLLAQKVKPELLVFGEKIWRQRKTAVHGGLSTAIRSPSRLQRSGAGRYIIH